MKTRKAGQPGARPVAAEPAKGAKDDKKSRRSGKPGEGAEEKKPKGKGKKTPQPIKPPKHKRQFAIEQLEQKRGFKVMPTSEADKTPASLRIRMAYEVMQGNAFSYYHPSDFDLSNQAAGMRIAYKHCHPISCRNNEIEVVIENPEFAVEVTGFDANRDLRVDVKPDYQNNSAGGAE